MADPVRAVPPSRGHKSPTALKLHDVPSVRLLQTDRTMKANRINLAAMAILFGGCLFGAVACNLDEVAGEEPELSVSPAVGQDFCQFTKECADGQFCNSGKCSATPPASCAGSFCRNGENCVPTGRNSAGQISNFSTAVCRANVPAPGRIDSGQPCQRNRECPLNQDARGSTDVCVRGQCALRFPSCLAQAECVTGETCELTCDDNTGECFGQCIDPKVFQ